MAAELVGGDLARSMNSRGRSLAASPSVREIWTAQQPDVFSRNGHHYEDDEAELLWAAIDRLPTYDRLKKGILTQVLEGGRVVHDEVDMSKLGVQDKKQLLDSVLKIVEEDNEKLLKRLRARIDRVGIEIPKIEVRYEHLSVHGDVHIGSRALPSLVNVTLNAIESVFRLMRLVPSKKKKIIILEEISGIVKPSRMTLLLGPPGAGKTTLLLALAGKLDHDDLKVSGSVTYCGHKLKEFVPQKTCAYIGQHDLHHGEMTVRETLDFAGRCLGIGSNYDMLAELSRREKEAGVHPDPEIDAFMKATSLAGQETSFVTDYVLKILGLDICADIKVGNDMRRGISGGQKKRVTTGEMLVGPAKALFMDEISTGLDSSTTFQIVKFMRQMVHIMDVTMIISLLQPAPETFDLFDDIILLSEGQIVYQGPREDVLEFFAYVGFKCPERKGVADFLQEVTSKNDQEQYWFIKNKPYRYISVPKFVRAFKSFHISKQLSAELKVPYDKSTAHQAALVKKKYDISNWELFKACFSRELLLMRRNSFIYIFKIVQITIMSLVCMSVFFRTEMPYGTLADGGKYFGALFFSLINVMFNGTAELSLTLVRLPVFYKQRDFYFFPAWAFALPIWILRIPLSFMESAIWVILTYYTVGFAPAASRFFKQFLAYFSIHQMALSIFRFLAAVARVDVVAYTLSTVSLLLIFTLGGFIISKDNLQPWLRWAYYFSPIVYGQNAIVINEFLDERWSAPNPDPRVNVSTVGKALLKSRGFFTDGVWYWYCIAALLAFSFLFNFFFVAAVTYLKPYGDSKAVVPEDDNNDKESKKASFRTMELNETNASEGRSSIADASNQASRKGMVLPFQPFSLAFNQVNYYVDMPAEMKNRGVNEDRLKLLHNVSGAFRPGVLTALMGVSGAGKTTLIDVLAGRKTGGYIEGSISVSGYPKNQTTFARISGYCEQNDIHSPNVTVYESLLFSAWLRLSSDTKTETRKMFVEEVMHLVELEPLRNALVGLPGVNGLSTEQRKRLTIAVELVANPSIIFMDEPTSGLDARAAAIVMRTVRNTVDTGRTVVCTIHQPSIDIFESFDELLLMKRGGHVIFAGPLGRYSHDLIKYFEAIPGVAPIKDGYNPATWMLEITGPSVEAQLNVDFGEIYAKSSLYQRNQEIVKEHSSAAPGSKELYFPSKYSQSYIIQCQACFYRIHWSYWKNPKHNVVRFIFCISIGILFGVIFKGKGDKTENQQDLLTIFGAMYSATLFLGSTLTSSIIPVLSIEKSIFYRERAAGMYSALPYAFAQVAVEVTYIAIQAIVYTLLIYSLIGYEWSVGKVFWFYYFILMAFTYYSLYGMMVVALTPNRQIAGIAMSFFTTLWNLFSGFLIPRPQIPIWWRWYSWASPVSWTLYGLIVSQVGDKDTELEIPGADDVPLKLFLKETFGFDHGFLPFVAVAHVGWVFLFTFIFAFGFKFFNFQRR